MFGLGKKRATGVHIGDGLLHIVELGRSGRAVELRAVFRAELASPDLGKELRGVLRQATRDLGLRFANTCIALGRGEFHLKRWPLVEGAGVRINRENLLWEAGQFLSGDPADYGIDTVLGREWGYVVAAHRRVLDRYLDFSRQAGFDSPELDIVPFALHNALEASRPGPVENLEVIVGLSRSEIHTLLVRDGELAGVLSRSFPQEKHDARIEAVVKCIDALLGEENRGEDPQRFWVADLSGCADWREAELADRYSASSALLDPFQNLSSDRCQGAQQSLLASGSEFAVAAGLAYRGLAGR